MFDTQLLDKAKNLLATCEAKGLRIATVESCTGGLLAGCLTEVPGSSAVVERGYVTYSNEAKAEEVGVDPSLIQKFGAVSREVAEAMAKGALETAPVQLTAAITGVAGPAGGSTAKPVGLVYTAAAARDGGLDIVENRFTGDRAAIRRASVLQALDQLLALAKRF